LAVVPEDSTQDHEDLPQVHDDVRPGIWELALPSILGNLSFTLVGMVQTKVIGSLGAQSLAAVGAGQRVFFAMQAVLMAVSAGTTALVARSWGARDYSEASRVTMASLVLAGGFALAVTVLGLILAPQVAALFGLDPHTLELATGMIRWIAVFNLSFAVNFIMGAALRASGDAWSPLWISVGVNLINVPLMYALVFGIGGLPAMGVSGVAIAAGLSFTLGGAILLALWVRQKFRVKHVRGDWWQRERLRRLLDIGYPAAVEQGVFQIGFFVFLMLIGNFYGTEAFAAYNIGVNMLMVCLPGKKVAIKVLNADISQDAEQLARFFLGDEPLTIRYTVEFTRILGAMMPLLAVEFAIGGSLRGAGDTRFPLIATFFGLIGMRCGLAALFTFLQLPVIWVYGAIVGDYLLKGALLLWRFHTGRWRTLYGAGMLNRA